MRRVALVALVLVLTTAAACGVPADDRAEFVNDEDVPFGLLDPPTTATSPTLTTTVGPTVTRLCFAVDGGLVVVERAATPGAIAEVLALLEQGPTRDERRFGLTSAVTPAGLVASAVAAGGVARVDLAPSFAEVSAGDQAVAVGQIVCTLTAQPGVGQVLFTLAGQPIGVPRGDGSTATGPVTRDDYAVLIRGG